MTLCGTDREDQQGRERKQKARYLVHDSAKAGPLGKASTSHCSDAALGSPVIRPSTTAI